MKKRDFLYIAPVIILFLFVILLIFNEVHSKKETHLISQNQSQYASLVDVGNCKLNFYVQGNPNSEFLLVFMAGSGTCSPVLDFKSLYSLFLEEYQIVVVEKSGYGFSDVGNSSRNIETILEETRTGLLKLGLLNKNQKLVLVPHSMSQLEAQYWCHKFPNEVSAIISLDGAIPQTYKNMQINTSVLKLSSFALKTGLPRLLPGIFNSSSALKNLSEQEKDLYKEFFYKKSLSLPMIQEAACAKENALKVAALGPTEIPMLFFVSNAEGGTGYSKKEWHSFFENFAKENKNAKIIKLDCPHYVHNFEQQTIFQKSCNFLDTLLDEPKLLKLFRKSYPQIKFSSCYDFEVEDWKIEVSSAKRKTTLYWADGKFLPKENLFEQELYSSLLYTYSKLQDPSTFTKEDIERIRNFTSPKNRQSGKGTPPFLYNFIYDSKTRVSTESHIKTLKFLKKRTNAHEFIHPILEKVQQEIFEAAKSDSQVNDFLNQISSADSYSWRVISDSGNRSFHSLGLAIDILPKGWGQKNLYWAWRRDIDKDNWMLLPLERRWMPPKKVIDIFESYGFLWGGKWIIWDNMHFEYRPEVILYNKMKGNL